MTAQLVKCPLCIQEEEGSNPKKPKGLENTLGTTKK